VEDLASWFMDLKSTESIKMPVQDFPSLYYPIANTFFIIEIGLS